MALRQSIIIHLSNGHFYSQATLGKDPNLPEDARAPKTNRSKLLHYCLKVESVRLCKKNKLIQGHIYLIKYTV